MPDSVKTRKVLGALRKLGFAEKRQKGSHLFLEHPDGRTTVIPLHMEVRVKLLTKIVKQDLKMAVKEFIELL